MLVVKYIQNVNSQDSFSYIENTSHRLNVILLNHSLALSGHDIVTRYLHLDVNKLKSITAEDSYSILVWCPSKKPKSMVHIKCFCGFYIFETY